MSESRFSVDVIIPTFNSRELLKRAIDSCVGQTYSVDKIIIVDDGSSEESINYLKEIERIYPKVFIIYNHHTGLPGVGRNLGILHSSANWIAFLDSDDCWDPEKIAKQAKLFQNADLIYTNGWRMDDRNHLELFHSNMPTSLGFKDMIQSNWIINSSVLVRREILLGRFGYATSAQVRAVEDYATWLRLSIRYKITGIDEPLVFYNDIHGSLSSEYSYDPRIHALTDFILWSRTLPSEKSKTMMEYRRDVLRTIKREYLK